MQAVPVILPFWKRPAIASFTLVEMLVSCAILVIILGVVLQLTNQVSQVWRNSASRIQSFQGAREGFETMTRKLSQATLNTYYDYYQLTNGAYILRTTNNATTFVPTTYDRVSELQFISGQARTLLANSPTAITTQTHAVFFQAPSGYTATPASYQQLDNALNGCGYFLEFDAGTSSIPSYILNSPSYKPRYRYRLMEMQQPTENLAVYNDNWSGNWFVNNAVNTAANKNSRILAENVIALVLLPKLPASMDPTGTNMAPGCNYNSRIGLGVSTATGDTNWTGFPGDAFTSQTNSAYSGVSTLTRHHQLPPIIQVMMIAIDEPSAVRLQALQGGATTVPPAINLAANTSLFTNAASLSNDFQTVQTTLTAAHVSYRIFYTDVLLRQAKWSNQ